MSTKPLTILLWNANGLSNHRDELDLFLHNNHIDIALLTETHFTKRIHFYIRDYFTYRTDHPDNTSHAGSCILIHKSLPHSLIPSTPTDAIQSTSVVLSTRNFHLTFSAVYCPPGNSLSYNLLDSLFKSLGSRFIAGGDYNAKHQRWGCRTSNPRGNILSRVSSSNNYSILSPMSPTYWPTSLKKRPDILDIFITSQISSSQTIIKSLDDLSSDHSPVLLSLHSSYAPKPSTPKLITGRVNWDEFRDDLENKLDLKIPLKTKDDINGAIEKLTASITDSINNNTFINKFNNSQKTDLPQHIRILLKEKRRARSKWHRTRYPTDKTHYTQLTNKLKSEIRKYKIQNLLNFTEKLTPTDKSLWTTTKRLLKLKTLIIHFLLKLKLGPNLMKKNPKFLFITSLKLLIHILISLIQISLNVLKQNWISHFK